MKTKFFRCKHCGNVIVKIVDSDVVPFCCGAEMEELVPHTSEMAFEKHQPMVRSVVPTAGNEGCATPCKEGGTHLMVIVGSVEHPMTEEHHIEFIYLETRKGGSFVKLNAGERPQTVFSAKRDDVTAVYAYCNLHGLWMNDKLQ